MPKPIGRPGECHVQAPAVGPALRPPQIGGSPLREPEETVRAMEGGTRLLHAAARDRLEPGRLERRERDDARYCLHGGFRWVDVGVAPAQFPVVLVPTVSVATTVVTTPPQMTVPSTASVPAGMADKAAAPSAPLRPAAPPSIRRQTPRWPSACTKISAGPQLARDAVSACVPVDKDTDPSTTTAAELRSIMFTSFRHRRTGACSHAAHDRSIPSHGNDGRDRV